MYTQEPNVTNILSRNIHVICEKLPVLCVILSHETQTATLWIQILRRNLATLK